MHQSAPDALKAVPIDLDQTDFDDAVSGRVTAGGLQIKAD